MQMPLAIYREPAGIQNRTDSQMSYVFLNIKQNIFQPMLHTPAPWYFEWKPASHIAPSNLPTAY